MYLSSFITLQKKKKFLGWIEKEIVGYCHSIVEVGLHPLSRATYPLPVSHFERELMQKFTKLFFKSRVNF